MTSTERYLLYKDYHGGLYNKVLSVELAVGIATLTGRTLVYYGDHGDDRALAPVPNIIGEPPAVRRHLTGGARTPTVLELLGPLPVQTLTYAEFERRTAGGRRSRLDSDVRLVGAVFVDRNQPADAALLASFADGRPVATDGDEEILHFSACNLGYYSRIFFDRSRKLDDALAKVGANGAYREFAAEIVRALGPFSGIHVRLNDFRNFLPYRGKDFPNEILSNLAANVADDEMLVISTDESSNRDFFAPITAHFRRHVFIDELIVSWFAKQFRALPTHDEVTLGLICNEVLREAREFLGTPGSTLSGTIQRALASRAARNGQIPPTASFKFVYAGSASQDVPFKDGTYLETRAGPFSWNRLEWTMNDETKTWYREWPESAIGAESAPLGAARPKAPATGARKVAGFSTSAYGRWSVAPPDLPRFATAASPGSAFDRDAIQRLLQGVGTELLFGGDPNVAIQRLESWGAPAEEARRIVSTAVADPLIVNGREMALMLRRRDWLLESLETLQQLSPRGKSIERRSELSGGEFLEFYYARNRPVVILGEMAGWRALSKWTLPFLQEAADRTPIGRAMAATADAAAVNIAMDTEAFAPLVSDLGALDKFLARGSPPAGGTLNIARDGAFLPLASEPRNVILAQIAGRSRLKLVAASSAAKVYARDGRTSEIADLEAPARTLAKYPLLAEAHVYDVALEAGEMLFVPMAWWHQVRTLEFGVVARFVNFRWPNDMDRSFPGAPAAAGGTR